MALAEMTAEQIIERFKLPERPDVPGEKERQRVPGDLKKVAYIVVRKREDSPTVYDFHNALEELNAIHEKTTVENSLNYLKSFVDSENKKRKEAGISALAMLDSAGVGSVSTGSDPELADLLASF